MVDDRSTDATAELAERTPASTASCGTTRRRGPGRGPQRRRARARRAPLLAFTDADCFPAAGLARARPRSARATPTSSRAASSPSARPARTTARSTSPASHGLFETANLARPRATCSTASAASSRAGRRRAARSSARTRGSAGAPGARRARRVRARRHRPPRRVPAHRAPRTSPSAAGSVAFPAIVDRVPELRSTLCWRRPFLTRRGAAFDAAALGLLAAAVTGRTAPARPRAPVPAPSARSRPRPPRDAVGAAALVSGSFSARSLLL